MPEYLELFLVWRCLQQGCVEFSSLPALLLVTHLKDDRCFRSQDQQGSSEAKYENKPVSALLKKIALTRCSTASWHHFLGLINGIINVIFSWVAWRTKNEPRLSCA